MQPSSEAIATIIQEQVARADNNLPPLRAINDTVTESNEIYPAPFQPLPVARRLMADEFTDQGANIIAWWQNDWWMWETASWQLVEDELDIKEPIWKRLGESSYSKDKDTVVPWAPTTTRVHNLMQPLQICSRLPSSLPAPMWLRDNPPAPAHEYISLSNGLLNITTMEMTDHTPEYFNTWALDFTYDAAAKCPTWDTFLGEVFEHDPAGQDLLQEMAGYFVSGKTDLQKALMLVGPGRSGKGTISRTLQKLVGNGNTVSPSLSSIGSEFGMAELIGKPLAVLEDARAADGNRNSAAVEKLLNVIGEDALSINRKNQSYWNGTLPTRFMLISNETPRFLDSSGAIATRFMAMKLTKSFKGKEDSNLGAKIDAELSGIFNWALKGLHRLEDHGKFTTPGTMAEMQDLLNDLASPAAKFLDENYTVTGDQGDYLTVSEVHRQFKLWCQEEEMETSNRDTFVQRLTAADPGVTMKNNAPDGQPKARRFFGIKVKPW